jgi:gentisate 1,2-dioxygenase
VTTTDRSGHWDDLIVDQVSEQTERRTTAKIVSHASEMVWGDTRMSHNTLAVSPLTGFALHNLHAHVDVLPPGGKSALHSHSSEAVMICLSGAGYTVIDGVRHDWAKGDVWAVPSGSWHQHFNQSEADPVDYFAVSNWPMTVHVGLSYLDYAPDGETDSTSGA